MTWKSVAREFVPPIVMKALRPAPEATNLAPDLRTSNLALNFGWRGTFIDGSEADIAKGRAYYERHPDTWLYPPTFIHCMVNRENINQRLIEASVPPEIDLMSIDIDGNDYWIWEAITATSPKVVIIETHVEFGFNNIVVP